MKPLIALFAAALMAVAVVGSAAAAPTNSKKSQVITLDCDNGETYDVVVNSNGAFSPGHLLDTNGVLIPTYVEINGTFTPTQGDPETFTEIDVKGNGNAAGPRETFTCTFGFTSEEEGGTATISGIVEAFFPGR